MHFKVRNNAWTRWALGGPTLRGCKLDPVRLTQSQRQVRSVCILCECVYEELTIIQSWYNTDKDGRHFHLMTKMVLKCGNNITAYSSKPVYFEINLWFNEFFIWFKELHIVKNSQVFVLYNVKFALLEFLQNVAKLEHMEHCLLTSSLYFF